MHRFLTTLVVYPLLTLGLLLGSFAVGSLAAPPAERQLAPGVLTTIAPNFEPDDTVSTHDIMEIRANPALQWNPEFLAATDTLYGMADKVKFRRDVYCLEFSFKPLRMIEVDVPVASGGTERKLVWYLVYRVRNTGQVLKPVEGEDGVFTAELGKGGPVRFMPQFVLESQDRHADGKRVPKVVSRPRDSRRRGRDQPRETPGQMLLNSVEMAEQPIPVSDGRIDRGVWGVATWTDVDPRIDFFSVYVGGLTNAYRWDDNAGRLQAGRSAGHAAAASPARCCSSISGGRATSCCPTSGNSATACRSDKADLYDVADGVAYRWVYR